MRFASIFDPIARIASADGPTKVHTAEHAAAYDVGRWDRELAADLEPLYLTAGCPPDVAAREASSRAARVNADTLTLLVAKENAFSTAREAALYG